MKPGMYKRTARMRPPAEPAQTLGELMMWERLRLRMTQQAMAQAMGCRQSRISEYETSTRLPSRKTLRRFISLFSLWPWQNEYWALWQAEYDKRPYNAKNRLDNVN